MVDACSIRKHSQDRLRFLFLAHSDQLLDEFAESIREHSRDWLRSLALAHADQQFIEADGMAAILGEYLRPHHLVQDAGVWRVVVREGVCTATNSIHTALIVIYSRRRVIIQRVLVCTS